MKELLTTFYRLANTYESIDPAMFNLDDFVENYLETFDIEDIINTIIENDK